MKNLIFFIIALIFSFITIIDSNLLSTFWLSKVFWSFEFTKVTLINIFIPIFSIFFLIKNFKKKIYIPKIVFIIFGMFLLSSIFAEYKLTNIFGNNMSWHWIILFANLTIFFTILLNFEKNKIEKIIKYITLLSPIVFILYILEYSFSLKNFTPSFHEYPNYLALYCLMILPFILKRIWFTINYYLNNRANKENINFINFFKWKYFYIVIFILLTISLFLTKITLAIIIYIAYIFYFFSQNSLVKEYKKIFILIWLILTIIIFTYIWTWLKSEIQNLISKFWIWEASFKAFSWDLKNIAFWVWNDSLWFKVDWYKSWFLYIFEWFNFKFEKPNNFILHIIYSFGFLWFTIMLSCFYDFISKYQKKSAFFHIITIFFIFCFFNHSSAINYIFLVIIISYIMKRNELKYLFKETKVFFIIFWVFSIISSFIYYNEESKSFKKDLYVSENKIYKKLKFENYQEYILNTNSDFFIKCEEILKNNKSIENYFYCWNIFWKNWYKSTWKIYYKKWLEKLPDLWNKESIFFKNLLIKYFFDDKKYFNDKNYNLKEILQRTNKEF